MLGYSGKFIPYMCNTAPNNVVAANVGKDVTVIYQADGKRAHMSLRPGMVELLHAAANGEADVLVVVDAAHLYCGRPELEGLLASLLHYGIHTFGAKDGNWIEPGGRRWMVLPGYDEEVWNG